MKKLVHYKKVEKGKTVEEFNDPSLFDVIAPSIKAQIEAHRRAIEFCPRPNVEPCDEFNNGWKKEIEDKRKAEAASYVRDIGRRNS